MSNDNVSEDKILASIKKLLGLQDDITAFDVDITMHINSVFANLASMGVGKKDPTTGEIIGFTVTTGNETWGDFTDNDTLMNNVKTYVYIKVKMIFDPPTTGSLINAYKDEAKEIEYRLYTYAGGY